MQKQPNQPSLFKRLRNIWRLGVIESVQEFDEKKFSFFAHKKLATFIDPKSEVEKLEELIKKNG